MQNNSMNYVSSRRAFLKRSALTAALAGVVRPFNILRAQGVSPNSKLRYAMIGPGGKGMGDFGAALGTRMVDCVAICDVYRPNAEKALKKAPQAKIYSDYRVMFDEIGDQLDAVMISTPDHNHFGPAYLALQRKIPVFLQKPIAHGFDQTERLVAAAAQAGVATQAGTQGLSAEGVRNLKEWVDAGIFGEIRELHAWCAAGGRGPLSEVLPAEPIPPDIAWDPWLGPAPVRPHNTRYYAGHMWPVWRDFSSGPIAGMGSHTLSALHYGVGLPLPEKMDVWVSSDTTLAFPRQSRVTFHMPAIHGRKPFKLYWYDGGKDNKPPRPPDWDEGMPFPPGKPEDWDDTVSHFPTNGGGALIIGSKASAIMYDIWGMSCHIYPRARFAELRSSLPPKTIPRYKGNHVQNWVDAITGAIPAPSAPFDFAGHVNNICMLGSIATQVNRSLSFDAEKKEFTGDAEASELLRGAGGYYARKGYPG